MFALFGFVSLAVDLGRVRMTRAQLQGASDAAALAAVVTIPDLDFANSTQTAIDVAGQNIADAHNVVLDGPSDVEYGYWSVADRTFLVLPHTFADGTTLPQAASNAVRVTGRLLASRNTQVNLIFARVVGIGSSDIQTPAIAWIRGGNRGFGIVGLNYVKMVGTTETDSFDPALGPYGGTNKGEEGTIVSNGSITLTGNTIVRGDVRPGVNETVVQGDNVTVTGWEGPLDEPVYYPPDSFNPTGYTAGNAFLAAQGWLSNGKKEQLTFNGATPYDVPSGTYYVDSVKAAGSNTVININAPMKLYVQHDVDISGGQFNIIGATPTKRVEWYINGDFSQTGGAISNPQPAPPESFLMDFTGSGTTAKITSGINGHIYAPLTDVTLAGNGSGPIPEFYGWIVGKSVTINGNAIVHYDGQQDNLNTRRRGVLVK
jgi:hypothetical protein